MSNSADAASIKLFDTYVNTTTGGNTSPASATAFDTKDVTLTCPQDPVAVISSTEDGTGNIIVDNFITINGQEVGDLGNVCTTLVSGTLNCFTTPAGCSAGADAFTTHTSVSPVVVDCPARSDLSPDHCLSEGTNSYTFRLMDWGSCYASSDLYLVTNCMEGQVVDLCAGQTYDTGMVNVWDDGENLYVKYIAEDGWLITEAHLAVCNIFDYTNKKGNPIPGHFPKSMTDSLGVAEYEFPPIPLSDIQVLGCGCSINIAAHAVVKKVIESAPRYPSSVVSYSQGLRQNGTAVLPERSDPLNALVPDYSGGAVTFFSLGFGGSIVVDFACPVVNGEGDDIAIWEVTNGTYPPEVVEVYASQDGMTWTSLGQATNGRTAPSSPGASSTLSTFDLGSLAWAKYISIVDISDPTLFEATADSFDLDGIAALQDCVQTETAWGDGCEGSRFVEQGNWATYFTYDTCED